MDKRKLIQIIIFIVIVAGLAWLLWYLFWREDISVFLPDGMPDQTGRLPGIDEGPPTGVIYDPVTGLPISGEVSSGGVIPSTSTTPTGTEPISDRATGGLTTTQAVIDKNIIGLKSIGDGKTFNYYDPSDNKFYRLLANGEVQLLSDRRFFNVDAVSWSPDGDKAILEYPDSSNIFYDFLQDRQVTLPRQMTEFNFSQSGENIGFKWESTLPNDDWLGIATPDGSDIKFVEAMNNAADDVQVAWSPNSQVIAFYREGKGLNQSEVFMVGQHGENFKSLTVPGRGFEGQWLEDGKHVIYQIYSDNSSSRPMLWLTRADGDNIGLNNSSLGIQTWLNKCDISGATAYCAVPEYLPEGAAYVPEIADTIPDLFYKIDLVTGAKTLLAKPVGDQSQYTAGQVMVSQDGSVLYFTDKATGRLYSINL